MISISRKTALRSFPGRFVLIDFGMAPAAWLGLPGPSPGSTSDARLPRIPCPRVASHRSRYVETPSVGVSLPHPFSPGLCRVAHGAWKPCVEACVSPGILFPPPGFASHTLRGNPVQRRVSLPPKLLVLRRVASLMVRGNPAWRRASPRDSLPLHRTGSPTIRGNPVQRRVLPLHPPHRIS